MSMRYYVQEIAGNYEKNVMEGKVEWVDAVYLNGLEPKAFAAGFAALTALMRSLWAGIKDDPADFGMLLKERVVENAKGSDYTNSNASLLRIPNLLFVLGLTGTLDSRNGLVCEGEKLSGAAKFLKVTGIPLLMKKLGDFGFEVEGIGKTMRAGDRIALAYPDTPALLVALKAMAEAQLALNKGKLNQPKNYFYMMHSGLLTAEYIKAPRLTIEDFMRPLELGQRDVAEVLHQFAAPKAKAVFKFGGFMRNDWSCVYTGIKNKRVLMTLHIEQDKLSAKLNLPCIGRYIEQIQTLPVQWQESICNGGWDCGRCHSNCAGGFAFMWDGKPYNKCRCGSFLFSNITQEAVPPLISLLTWELAV